MSSSAALVPLAAETDVVSPLNGEQVSMMPWRGILPTHG
jgi:hypothetical protein